MFTPPPSPRPYPRDALAPSTPSGSRSRSPAASDRLAPSPVRLHRAHRPPSILLTPPETLPSVSPSPSLVEPEPEPKSEPKPELATPSLSPQEKKRIGSRTRLVSLFLVPAILFLITLSTRAVAHPAALDLLTPHSDTRWSVEAMTNWRPHKRHPSPQDSGSGSGQSAASSLIFPSGESTTPTPTTTATVSSGSSGTVPTVPASTPVLPTPFPQPFDSTLGQNFTTQDCQNFFANMTQSTPFRSCRPFSLLFHQSAAFINAQSNLTLFNSVVWGTCNTVTPSDQCNSNMGWFASQMQTTCKAEITAQNPLVVSALTGLQAYSLMRQAGCTTNPLTNTYCLIDAVRAPTASDIYYFGLPLGTPLPATTVPTCSSCTKSLLGLYAPYAPASGNANLAANSTASLPALGNNVYEQAAGAANKACGQDFATGAKGSGAGGLRPVGTLMASFVLLAVGMAW